PDAKLRLDCIIEVRVAGIFFHQLEKRFRRAEVLALLFVQLSLAIERSRREGIFGMTFGQASVSFYPAFDVAFFFSSLRDLEQFGRVPAYFLLSGHDELRFLSRFEDNGRRDRFGENECSGDE